MICVTNTVAAEAALKTSMVFRSSSMLADGREIQITPRQIRGLYPTSMTSDPTDPPDRREEELFTLIPRKRTTTFDMRRAITLMADRGSFFEID